MHADRYTTELSETYLAPLFETKTILFLINNHCYMAKATFGRITQYIRQFVVRLLA